MNGKFCAVVSAKLNVQWQMDFALLLIPCNFVLQRVGYGCEKVESKSSVKTYTRDYGIGKPKECSKTGVETFIMEYGELTTVIFRCLDGTFIVNYNVCDGYADCPDGGDEKNCSNVCQFHNSGHTVADCYTSCHVYNCTCQPLYYQCEVGGCVPVSKICDGLAHCTDSSDEAHHLCPTEIKSDWGRVHFLKPDRFNKDIFDIVGECIGGRLRVDHLCDGIRQCESGADEWTYNCSQLSFRNALRCGRKKGMVHICTLTYGKTFELDISDRKVYPCASAEYMHVYRSNYRLPSSCQVKGMSVFCKNVTDILLSYMTVSLEIIDLFSQHTLKIGFKYYGSLPIYMFILKITNSNLSLLNCHLLTQMKLLTKLELYNDMISVIEPCSFHGLQHLSYVDLHANPIQHIVASSFINSSKLRHLDLSQTMISQFHSFTLPHLQVINLSFTQLKSITSDAMQGLPSLHVMDISHLDYKLNSAKEFDILRELPNLTEIRTVHFEICCLFKRIVCISDVISKDIFFKCRNIIYNDALHAITYLYAILSFICNSVSVLWHLNGNSGVQMIMSLSLHFADTFISVYLVMILIINYLHDGDLVYVAVFWKKTATCHISGTIMMISIMASNACTFVIAIDRYICIYLKPFQRYGLTTAQVFICYISMFFISILPVLLVPVLSSREIGNSLCIPLGNSVSPPFSIYYSIYNVLIFILTFIAYGSIMVKLKKGSLIQKSGDKSLSVIIRLGAVVLTNFIPAVTVTVLSVLALLLDTIPASLEAYVAFFLFPINACLNPIINTISTKRFCSNLLQYIYTMSS